VIDVAGFPKPTRPEARRALRGASLDAYRLGIGIAGALAILSGLLSLGGITNRRRVVAAESCAGGALYGASPDAAGARLPQAQPLTL
jgi:hypothetical protein